MNTKKFLTLSLIAVLGIGTLAACEGSSPIFRSDVANRVAAPAWMIKREIPAGPFAITAYERMHERGTEANLYIEGDGEDILQDLTNDPTPKNPVALHLASRDKADNLVWLARPCQYSDMVDDEANCEQKNWGEGRFSPEILSAYNAALNEIKARYEITKFNLIGFDGGAAIAAILAAQRNDVASLRTVAGNLEHQTHSAEKASEALEASLNPIDFSERLRLVPQMHFIGGQDTVVSPAVLHSYLQELGSTNCADYELIQEAEHRKGWVDKWPALLEKTPTCQGMVEEVNFDEIYLPPEPIKIQRELPSKK